MANLYIQKLDASGNTTVLYTITNNKMFNADYDTPVTPMPLPQNDDSQNILIKVEGNSSELTENWVIKTQLNGSTPPDVTQQYSGYVAIAAANTSAKPTLPFDQILFLKTFMIPKLITDGYRLTVADSVKLGSITIVNAGDGSPSSSYYQPIFSAAGQPTDPVTGSSAYYVESGTITKLSTSMGNDSQVSFDATLDFMVGNVVSLYEANTPSSPQNFASTAGAGGSHTINLSWTAPVDTAGGLTGYKVYRKVWNGFYAPIATLGVVLSYSDNTCTTGTVYYYIVAAFTTVGIGIPSPEISRSAP